MSDLKTAFDEAITAAAMLSNYADDIELTLLYTRPGKPDPEALMSTQKNLAQHYNTCIQKLDALEAACSR